MTQVETLADETRLNKTNKQENSKLHSNTDITKGDIIMLCELVLGN